MKIFSRINLLILAFIIVIVIYSYNQCKNMREYYSENIALPNGSWKKDCEVVSYQYPILWATCNDDKGKPNDTSIDLTNCPEFIHTDPDSEDPLHKYLDRNVLMPKSLCNVYPHQHRLKVENGELKCEYSDIS